MPNYKRSDLRNYLGRYFPARRHLKSLYKRAAAIKYEMDHPTVGAIKLDGMPRSGRISDPTPLLLERYESALEKIENQKLCIEHIKSNTQTVLDFLLDGTDNKNIMELKYIDGKTDKEIQKIFYFSDRSTVNYHINQALDELLRFEEVQHIIQQFKEKGDTQ